MIYQKIYLTGTILRFLLFLGVLQISSCLTTKLVTLKSPEKATVSALPIGSIDEKGDFLGETPVVVDLEKVSGKMIKIAAEGKIPMYWVISDTVASDTEIKFNLLSDPLSLESAKQGSKSDKNDRRAAVNRILRLVMQSYKALTASQYELARNLAEKAAEIDPELAAPQIIKGMALLKEGKSADARAALNQAKALDPGDTNIDQLLKVIK